MLLNCILVNEAFWPKRKGYQTMLNYQTVQRFWATRNFIALCTATGLFPALTLKCVFWDQFCLQNIV